MKKILFIDRDGTIIKECTKTYQIDNLDKLSFYPRVIFFLSKIVHELDYILVMISNQDGLGTKTFPETKFLYIHNHILNILKSENIIFSSIYIDRTYWKENFSTRKPGIKMLVKYLNNPCYDIKNSFVIGDRLTDVLLANNLGCKAIWIKEFNHYDNLTEEEKEYKSSIDNKIFKKVISLKTNTWKDIYNYLLLNSDINSNYIKRRTSETDVNVSLFLYGNGNYEIKTGIGFFDHLLKQISIHSFIDIKINILGDLYVDDHHTIEDVAITIGNAFYKLLKINTHINRYGFFILPMDDCLSQVAIDIGGREHLSWNVNFIREKIGNISTEMFYHFFKSFTSSAKISIHISSRGNNEHHKIESIFKCFAKAMKIAIERNKYSTVLSSKGLLY